MKTLLSDIRKDLKANADPKVALSTKHFFKEEIKVYGLKSAEVKKITAKHLKTLRGQTKAEVFAAAEQLFKSGYMDEFMIGAAFVQSRVQDFAPADFKTFERWVKTYITNWAECDTFCNHTMGDFVTMYPAYVPAVMKWATSKNLWVRRAAAVTFILPARGGKFLKEVYKIADTLLLDEEDMVQKGYGWMLKAAADYDYKPVFAYVLKHKAQMPRTALRYAIEKMPADVKKKAMTR